MPQVDFYILDSAAPTARWEFVARLLGKLQKLNKTACIAVDSNEAAEQLDALLWRYPPESFVPHRVERERVGTDCVETGPTEPTDEPFTISSRTVTGISQDVLINLRNSPPEESAKLQRLVEVVVQEASVLNATRRNFRFYREQGYPIQSHHIRAP
ncbi:MAG: DNA polymerase III subunit chi [Cellvibrionaceae bacterium]